VAVVLASVLLALGPGTTRAAMTPADVPKEYQVKAVFLFNFVNFVEWPPQAFSDPESPIYIGVLGVDPFGAALDDAVRGETVRNRPVVVRRAYRWQDLRDCHLVFISRSERGRLREILNGLHQGLVVTASEIDDFTRYGGTIRFFQQDNKVRFEINPAEAQRRGLRFSAQLLSVARVVPWGPTQEGKRP
jgi:hypothetical protein